MRIAVLVSLTTLILSAPAGAALTVWRTTVTPGGQTLVWTRQGNLPTGEGGSAILNAWQLSNAQTNVTLTEQHEGESAGPDDAGFATTLNLPSDVAPGDYSLFQKGADTGVKINVAPLPNRRKVFLSPKGRQQDDTAAIQAALAENVALVLEPGVYEIISTISIPRGASVSGESCDAVILRRHHNSADYQDSVFTSSSQGGVVAITDLTLDGSAAIGTIIFHSDIENRNFELARVKLFRARGPLGNMPGQLVEDVEFLESCVMVTGPALYRRVHFQGISHVSNEIIALGAGFAMIDCTWQDTDRGIVLRAGPNHDYFQSLTFTGITHVPNGNEGILHEDLDPAGPIAECIFSHITFRMCHGSAFQFGSGAINNLVQHLDVDGGHGIWFSDTKMTQSGNVFRNCELRNCMGIDFGHGKGNVLDGVAIIHPQAGWINEDYFHPGWYPARSVAIRGAAGNIFRNVVVRDLPVGWTTGIPEQLP
jgi:hypothetical protein